MEPTFKQKSKIFTIHINTVLFYLSFCFTFCELCCIVTPQNQCYEAKLYTYIYINYVSVNMVDYYKILPIH